MNNEFRVPEKADASAIATNIRNQAKALDDKLREIDTKRIRLGEIYKDTTQAQSASKYLTALENTENEIRGMRAELENLALIYDKMAAEEITGGASQL